VIIAISCNQKNTETATKIAFNLKNAKLESDAADKTLMALVAAGDTTGLANAYTLNVKFIDGSANIQKATAGILKSGTANVDIRLAAVHSTENLFVEDGLLTIYIDKHVIDNKSILLYGKKRVVNGKCLAIFSIQICRQNKKLHLQKK